MFANICSVLNSITRTYVCQFFFSIFSNKGLLFFAVYDTMYAEKKYSFADYYSGRQMSPRVCAVAIFLIAVTNKRRGLMSQGKITDKQKEILEYIKEMILKKGYPPAVREICEAVHLKSTSSVHSHLESLEKNGYIRRDPTKPRTIEILDDDFALTRREVVNVPVIGTVAAGTPILAEQNIEDYLPIPAEMLPNKEVFMLKVKGNSMIEAGIYSGDKVIVAKQPDAENGDKVVALVDDSATVKTFYKENGHFRLQPENSTMDPIILDHVEILGKVIGLFRMMS